jgi:coenzyme F420-0:L-glutamate ligase/coenzyme F420-1:gamma-L-glutamate ligase
MEFIPIKTRILQPPKDDLFSALDESLTDVREGDIILVTSKVVAIHQGRCVKIENGEQKATLVKEEADLMLDVPERKYPLTVKYHALISGAGIDESNGDGFYVYLPDKPFEAAKELYSYIQEKHGIKNVAVIITDSHSLPFRYGAMSIAISFWGLEPVDSHIGEKDIFGREFHVSRTNLVDSLAAASALVSGEGAEQQPVVVARNVPHIQFTERDTREELLVPLEDDLFKSLFEKFHKKP